MRNITESTYLRGQRRQNDSITELAGKSVTGPASATAGNLAALDSTGKVLSDSLIHAEYVPIIKDRQNVTTNTTVSNQREQIGWGYISGAAVASISTSVTFPVEYDDIPLVFVQFIGQRAKADGDPSGVDWFTTASIALPVPYAFAAAGFGLYMFQRDGTGAFSANHNYGFVWLAIGTKARS